MLTDKEMVYNEDIDGYEPCTECLDVIMDTAYSQGFKTEDEYEYSVDEEFDEDCYAEFNNAGERIDGQE